MNNSTGGQNIQWTKTAATVAHQSFGPAGSAGTKLVLYSTLDTAAADYAIGVAGGTL
jgi:hypothetical protein